MKQKTAPDRKTKTFSTLLLKWNKEQNDRPMPWKGEKDPYKIWLSEIILQQTRVEQGLGYYQRFVRQFPDILSLASAPDPTVFKLWEGLGYYSRCRNLLFTARQVATDRKGIFPGNYNEIVKLKGVGPYTAAAIASFAFNQPHAVVDGNVFRVLARVFGIDQPIDSTAGKKYFTALAEELLDKKQPGLYNQAIMDFGATVCKPQLPLCENCVFRSSCIAFRQGRINELPVKEKKTKIRKRWFYYFVFESKGLTAIRQRTGKDIWNQLYEFPAIETEKAAGVETVIEEAQRKKWFGNKPFELLSVSPVIQQQLSHQRIAARFIYIRLNKPLAIGLNELWVKPEELAGFAFPKLIRENLENGGVHK